MPTSPCGRPSFWRTSSADHLVRLKEEGWRNRQAEGFRRLEIDHQLELHGLLDGEVARLGAFENLVHEDDRALELRETIWPIEEAPVFRKLVPLGERWQAVCGGEVRNLLALAMHHHKEGLHKQRLCPRAVHRRKGTAQLLKTPDHDRLHLHAKSLGSVLCVL